METLPEKIEGIPTGGSRFGEANGRHQEKDWRKDTVLPDSG